MVRFGLRLRWNCPNWRREYIQCVSENLLRKYMWSGSVRETLRMTSGIFIRATGKMELSLTEIDKKWKLKSRREDRGAFDFQVGGRAACVCANGMTSRCKDK